MQVPAGEAPLAMAVAALAAAATLGRLDRLGGPPQVDPAAVLGVDAVVAADPFVTPAPARPTPAPLFLTATHEAWKDLYAAYRDVLGAFLEASRQLGRGAEGVVFPEGTFPPAGPMRGPPAGRALVPRR